MPPSAGRLIFDGREKNFNTPADSLREGIVMVYQETSSVPTMTVAQNLRLGAEAWLTRFSSINREARDLLRVLDFDVEPLALVEDLGTAKRQMVEIARAVRMEARLQFCSTSRPRASRRTRSQASSSLFGRCAPAASPWSSSPMRWKKRLNYPTALQYSATVDSVRTGPTSGLDRTTWCG